MKRACYPKHPPIPKNKRARILARYNHTCQGCGATDKVLDLDHKTPKTKGGSNKEENLWPLCKSCNSSKGTKTVEEWLRWLNIREPIHCHECGVFVRWHSPEIKCKECRGK